jgi:multidrug efflux pump subunit AcrB
MSKLIDLLFTRSKLFLLLSFLLLLFGLYSYWAIPKQNMPNIEATYMVIQVDAPGESSVDIEKQSINDIESIVLTFPEVDHVSSTIHNGYALIYVLFSYEATNLDRISEEIFNKVNQLSFDESITDISYTKGKDDPHIIYSVSSNSLSKSELSRIAKEFKNTLLTKDEISTVKIDDPFSEEIIINLDEDKINQFNLSIYDVYSILKGSMTLVPLGEIDSPYGPIQLSSDSSFKTIEDLKQFIIIPEIVGVSDPIVLQDVASVSKTENSNKEYTFDDNTAVFLSVTFNKDLDFTKLSKDMRELTNEFLKEHSDTIYIGEMLFLPDVVDQQINSVFYSLLLAIGIVMFVVLIGIGPRNSLLIVLAIPLIVFGTIGVLYLGGYELQKLTIVGLIVAIGIIVDNSIVITENIKYHIDQNEERLKAGKQAIKSSIGPILSSTLTTIAAFLVIILLPGFLGTVVRSMPLTVVIALTLSFIISMTFSPIIAVKLLKSKMEKKTHKPNIHHQRILNMIRNTIKFPILWIALASLFSVTIIMIALERQPIDLYPNDSQAIIYVDVENNRFNDYESTKEQVNMVEKIIGANPNTIHISSSIGGTLPQFHFSAGQMPDLPQYGRVYATFNLSENDLLQYYNTLKKVFAFSKDATITPHLIEWSPPEPQLSVHLTSKNISDLENFSNQLASWLEELNDIQHVEQQSSQKSIYYKLTYHDDTIRNANLTRSQIDLVLSTHLNGFSLPLFENKDGVFPVTLTTTHDNLSDLMLYTFNPGTSKEITLGQLVEFTQVQDYAVITKQDGSFSSTFFLTLDDKSTISDMTTKIDAYLKTLNTENITIQYGGENQLFKDLTADLIRAGVIALTLIFIILFIQFNDFKKPFIILLTIPLAFGGGFLFVYLLNESITATGLIGLISLMGVTVNNGILLVDTISKYEKAYPLNEACAQAVLRRFRPVMLTSFTTILGLIPLYFNGGSFFRPLAVMFMGGMATSTLITIFLVPSVYKLFHHSKKQKTNK